MKRLMFDTRTKSLDAVSMHLGDCTCAARPRRQNLLCARKNGPFVAGFSEREGRERHKRLLWLYLKAGEGIGKLTIVERLLAAPSRHSACVYKERILPPLVPTPLPSKRQIIIFRPRTCFI